MTSRYDAFPDHLKTLWDTNFPDPAERGAWVEQFPGNVALAHWYSERGFDPVTARAWVDCLLDRRAVAYLHSRGHTPNHARVRGLIDTARDHTMHAPVAHHEVHHAAALMYAHPTLRTADAVLLARSGLTLTEADHLIETGAYDRDTVAALAGLR